MTSSAFIIKKRKYVFKHRGSSGKKTNGNIASQQLMFGSIYMYCASVLVLFCINMHINVCIYVYVSFKSPLGKVENSIVCSSCQGTDKPLASSKGERARRSLHRAMVGVARSHSGLSRLL